MSDLVAAAQNLGLKAMRRLGAAHKPFVRLVRRRGREAVELRQMLLAGHDQLGRSERIVELLGEPEEEARRTG